MHPAARVELVGRIRIISKDADPVEPIRELLKLTIAPELMDLVCSQALGHAKARADNLIRNGKAAKLNAGVFQEEFREFVRRNNPPNLLVSVAQQPGDSEVAGLLSSRPVFIRQLELIQASRDQQVRAVSDYLRTSTDRASWAETGLVFENDFEVWQDDLKRRHALTREEVAEMYKGESAEGQGRLTYLRCAKADVRLLGREVPGHFVHGSYTSLADLRQLGWHPDFETLLGGGG